MPHQCTGCGATYPDGTDGILSGCDECDGTTFQYLPEGAAGPAPDAESDATPAMSDGVESAAASTDDAGDHPAPEDASQHSARTDVVDAADLPAVEDLMADIDGQNPTPPDEGQPAPSPDVDLDALRQELNRQFEGIKILQPGQYEINLRRLFEREECVIALQEDGRYVISLPEDSALAG